MRVLIAEDEQDSAATLQALLQDEGHETRCVHHGSYVVDMVSQFAPDLVLLDIGMPVKTGYDIARELRLRYGSAKPILVAVTAYDKTADQRMTKAAGIDHHVGKPYDPQELLALIRNIADAYGPK